MDLISKIEKEKDDNQTIQALLKGVREKLHLIDSHLERTNPQMTQRLYALLSEIEFDAALRIGSERRQQAKAEEVHRQAVEQAEADEAEIQAKINGDDPPPH